ncbi:hypothetical protein HRI_000174800 [Hibiscus trionum]|uniref:SHSP domain-containing protein n=1 Tax=Hibiscus trionum TaxID=183268 RepID=A0A9W7GSX6_HIBTR|nr:hypothetical protein HRI_000174800 [Hibiscus trionum]
MFRSYQDFQPDCHYKEGEAHDIIEFQLKDFKKDQLKVHFGSNGVLTVSGERPLDGSKWVRFCKEFATPKDCKPTEIRARFSTSLYITIPKHVSQQDPPPPVQQETTALPLSPVRDEGKLKQSNSNRESREVADDSVTSAPTENAISSMASPKRSITWLKVKGETTMKIGASLIVAGMLFIVLFYVFKI